MMVATVSAIDPDSYNASGIVPCAKPNDQHGESAFQLTVFFLASRESAAATCRYFTIRLIGFRIISVGLGSAVKFEISNLCATPPSLHNNVLG